MKKSIVVILSFILFLPALNLQSLTGHQSEESFFSGISTVFEVQYNLYKQTKKITINMPDVIAKSISSISALCSEKTKLFFTGGYLFLKTEESRGFSNVKLPLIQRDKEILYYSCFGGIILALFLFIFTFLLKYLGLLRVFWLIFLNYIYKIKQSVQYKFVCFILL